MEAEKRNQKIMQTKDFWSKDIFFANSLRLDLRDKVIKDSGFVLTLEWLEAFWEDRNIETSSSVAKYVLPEYISGEDLNMIQKNLLKEDTEEKGEVKGNVFRTIFQGMVKMVTRKEA